MTTKPVAPAPVPQSPVEDTPPWIEREFVRDPAGTEAVTVAWTQIAMPYKPFTDEMSDPDEEPVKAYAPWNITFRGINQEDLIDKLAELTAMIAASDAKFITDKQFSEFALSQRFIPQPQASAPLPQAAPQAPRPQPHAAPQQGAVARPQPQQQGAPQQGERQPYPNPFTANELLITIATNTNDGSTYTKYTLQGMPFVKYGMRVWPDLLDRVGLVDTNGTPASQWQAGKYAIGNWSCSYNYDGNGKPKNVVSMEWIEG